MRITRMPVVALLALVLVVGAGCSDSGSDNGDDASATTPTSSSTTTTADPTTPPTGADCDAKPPGEIMTEDEAVIYFSAESVCPGYVTVATGTLVTWRNTGDVAFQVVVRADPVPDAPVYTEQTIQPGGEWQYEFIEPDQYSWRTDAIDEFVGSVDVRGSDTSTEQA
jgi:plastocyanin